MALINLHTSQFSETQKKKIGTEQNHLTWARGYMVVFGLLVCSQILRMSKKKSSMERLTKSISLLFHRVTFQHVLRSHFSFKTQTLMPLKVCTLLRLIAAAAQSRPPANGRPLASLGWTYARLPWKRFHYKHIKRRLRGKMVLGCSVQMFKSKIVSWDSRREKSKCGKCVGQYLIWALRSLN